MTLLCKSIADEIGLHGTPYIQPWRGLHTKAGIPMANTTLCVHGIEETESHLMHDVTITERGNVWYLPHFPTQARFRVVYDGFAQYYGRSINQDTHTGPDILVPFLNVLTRFRLGKYAVTADIKECFFQIGIPEAQRE